MWLSEEPKPSKRGNRIGRKRRQVLFIIITLLIVILLVLVTLSLQVLPRVSLSTPLFAPSATSTPTTTPSREPTEIMTMSATEEFTAEATPEPIATSTFDPVVAAQLTNVFEATLNAALTGTVVQAHIVSPTPSATATSQPTNTPVEAAAILVRIFSASGIEIGNGTVRVFAPDSVEASQSSIVELELNLDYRYITPTPAGPITPFPVTQITSTPRPGRATLTPRVPIYEENDITAYQRMGATLYCPPDRFTGCDVTEDPSKAKLINWENGAKWSWIIAPLKDVSGLQNMQLKLWTIKQVNDGPEQADVIWDYPFPIEVKSPTEAISIVKVIQENIDIVITGIFGIVAALIGAGYFKRRKAATARKKTASKKTDKPNIFISYRRIGGTSAAQNIKDRLIEKGADVFLDVISINEGRFEEIIKKAIEQCDHFILVLAPDTLTSEWVIKETLYAVQLNRKIIPILIDGFKLDRSKLPSGLESIEDHNAVNLTGEYYDAGINKLAKFVGLQSE